MIFKNLFGESEQPEAKKREVLMGRIYHLGQGWGFVSSPELEYTRIFFHWTGLVHNTLNFKDLKKGMKVEFEKKIMPDGNVRAIRVKVLEDKDAQETGS